MKFIQTGEIKPNALELSMEIEPQRRTQWLLRRFNHELGFIRNQREKDFEEYATRLDAHFQVLATGNLGSELFSHLDESLSQMAVLQEFPELVRHFFNFHLQLLGSADVKDWLQDRIQVAQKDAYRSVLLPACHNLLVLTQTLGREEAFKLYKRFVTDYVMERLKDREDAFESVEALYQNSIEPTSDPMGWVCIHGLLGDGKYAYKNVNCIWVEALADLDDAEVKYHICCYGDYQGAKSWNQHFILTMEHTIAQGDPYCSRVVHDPRVDWSLEHPPASFWDKMRP